jgi:hypothetical protein
VMCLGSQAVDIKSTIITKTSCAPLDIRKLIVQVVVKHFARASCTNLVNVMFISVRITYLVKTFLDKKLTFGHNQRAHLWNITDSIVLSGKKPWIMNNITFCRNFFCMSWSFRKRFGEEKKPNTKHSAIYYHLIVSSQSWWDRGWPNNLFFELLKQINMVLLHMFCHHWYAITLIISNEDFVAPCAQGQNIKAWCFFMANNASHNLRLLQINLLIIIYLEEHPSGQSPLVRLPSKQLFFHGFQQYLLI